MTDFHIYNQVHQKCVSRTGKRLSVAPCDLNKCKQKWSWTRGGQEIISAHGWENSKCISVSQLLKFKIIIMDPCHSNTSFQRWECKDGGLLSIKGDQLYLNFGKYRVDIILHTYGGIWSSWVKYSTGRSLCDKGWSYIFYSLSDKSIDSYNNFSSTLREQQEINLKKTFLNFFKSQFESFNVIITSQYVGLTTKVYRIFGLPHHQPVKISLSYI